MKKIINIKKKTFMVFGIFVMTIAFIGFLTSIGITSCKTVEYNPNQIDKVTISFESNYDPLPPEFAKMYMWGGPSDINGQNMSVTGGKYIFEAQITQDKEYIFNIETNNQPICGRDNNEWVAFKNGIRAKEIKVYDKVLDKTFLFDNKQGGSNFIFKVNQKGEIVPSSGTPITINENIPSEIWYLKETVHLPSSSLNNKYANAWFAVVHDTKKGGVSKIEIESLKLYARLNNGQDVPLATDLYDTEWGGKLYIRYPYFECSLDESLQWQMPAQLINGKLVFSPSDITNRVWHGWCTGAWPQVPINTNKLWIEAEIKITGNALMQIGVDIKPNQNTNDGWSEYGVSDWFFSTSNFQTVYFSKP